VREERIAVGPGPGTVGIGIRVIRRRGAHLCDHLINTRAAMVEKDLRPGPEPGPIRSMRTAGLSKNPGPSHPDAVKSFPDERI
jgi:hypothetical protein